MNSIDFLRGVEPAWASWVIENLVLGVAPEQIHQALSSHGLGDTFPLAALEDLRGRPEFIARMSRATHSDKFERALLSRYRLRCLRSNACIKRLCDLRPEEFFETFYCGNEPVIMTNLARNWPLMSDWSPQYLCSNYGDCVVEVQTGRNSDNRYETHIDSHRTRMSLRTFVGMVDSVGTGNDIYMCANNRALDSDLAGLFNEIPECDDYLDPQQKKGRTFLWFGPGGTITPLHYDVMNVLFVQIYGRKEFILAPPEALPLMYNSNGVFSDVDYRAPDFKRFPLFKNVQFISTMLGPGEALFIPVRWWHFVRAQEISIGLSCTNFIWPNEAEQP